MIIIIIIFFFFFNDQINAAFFQKLFKNLIDPKPLTGNVMLNEL